MPNWWTIGAVAVTALATLAGVGLKGQIDRRRDDHRHRVEAYEGLISTSEVLVLRVVAANRQRSFKRVVVSSVVAGAKVVLPLVFMSIPRASKHMTLREAIALAARAPLPDVDDQVTSLMVWQALEDLQRARVRVRLVGSDKAQDGAERLAKEAVELVGEATNSEVRPWREQLALGRLQQRRKSMLEAHNDFIQIARAE